MLYKRKKLERTLGEIKILPTITTTQGSDWRERIKEVNEIGLKEIALFPTNIRKKEREELYKLLEKSCVKNIPFVHLRSDMELEELNYLVETYGAKVFNTHTAREYPFIYETWAKYRKMIYIENVYFPLDQEELKKFAGICLDFSHLENDRLMHPETFKHNIQILERFPIGCNHIGAIKKEIWIDPGDGYNKNKTRHDFHQLGDLRELDYLKNYPLKYFSSYITIELENSIEEQLKIKDYIRSILKTL